MRRSRRWMLGLLLSVVVLPLAEGGCGKLVADKIDDAKIATDVKTTLTSHPTLGSMKIEAASISGIVTLTGKVPTREDEQAAITAVRSVAGVRAVVSALQISS